MKGTGFSTPCLCSQPSTPSTFSNSVFVFHRDPIVVAVWDYAVLQGIRDLKGHRELPAYRAFKGSRGQWDLEASMALMANRDSLGFKDLWVLPDIMRPKLDLCQAHRVNQGGLEPGI